MVEFDKVMQTLPTDADRVQMVALPYRIGLYISHADVTGGWEAQEAEMQSLNHILRAFSEDFCKSEFVQGLLMRTLSQRGEWVRWSQALDQVPGECVAAIYDLRGVLDAKQLFAFQGQMMEIAFAVAQAFRERTEAAPAPPSLWARLSALGRRPTRYDHDHISVRERGVLQTLADALDYDV